MNDHFPGEHPSGSLQSDPSRARNIKKKRRYALMGATLFLAPLALVLLLVCLAVEREPLIVETAVPTVDSVQRVRNLALAVQSALNGQRETASFSASQDDLNAVMTLVRRAVPRFSGRVRVYPWFLSLQASVRLPAITRGGYLNLRGELLPSQDGVNIASLKIGRIDLPPGPARALLRALLNLGLGSDEGTALMTSVRSLDMGTDTVRVTLGSLPLLKERLKRLQAKLSNLRDLAGGGDTPWDNSRVSAYYARLWETDRALPATTPPSLASYLTPLFQLARHRSVTGDPVRENSSALLALAIFLGDYRFGRLAGVSLDPGLRDRMPRSRAVLLGGREDLRLHFVISAGLKLLADQGASSAIGEFKELLDAGRGGSGFSFVDLAADRAGIRFAKVCTESAESARRLQERFSSLPREDLFFPAVADLPEAIHKADLEQRFGGVDSRRYRDLIGEIDRRIARCPAYGTTPSTDRSRR